MTNPHDIVIRPIVTEQSMADMADRKYTFVVQKGANKTEIKKAKNIKGKPICIICHTIKGKGISFMENSIQWHAIENQEMLKKALEELKDKF